MKKFIYLACLTIVLGCSKSGTDEELQKMPTDDKLIGVNLSNEFANAANIKTGSLKSSDFVSTPEEIENGMLEGLSDIYGNELEDVYYDNKNVITPDLSSYEGLSNLSVEELDEDNVNEFIGYIFRATKTKFKSTNESLISVDMQNNINLLMKKLENSANSFMVDCINNKSFEKSKLKDEFLNQIQDFKEGVNWNDLSTEEQDRLFIAISTIENSVDNFVEFSLSSSFVDFDQLMASSRLKFWGWVKKAVKSVAKVVVATVAGVAAGSLVDGGTGLGMIAGGMAGVAAGGFCNFTYSSMY